MSGVYFRDYLALLDRTATTREFAVYIAQFNLLNLPALMAQVCPPEALPSASLSLANLVGGADAQWPALRQLRQPSLPNQGVEARAIFPPATPRSCTTPPPTSEGTTSAGKPRRSPAHQPPPPCEAASECM